MNIKRTIEILAAREHAQNIDALPGMSGFYDAWCRKMNRDELRLVKRYHAIFKAQAKAGAAYFAREITAEVKQSQP